MSRDWSSLPADLITKISELHPLPLRTWLRMVCKSWCSAIPPIHIPSPWLLLPGDGHEYGEYTDFFTFYSIPTKTTFKCPFPPNTYLSGLHCVGSYEGFLVLCDPYFHLFVVNPLTGYGETLPPFYNSPYFNFGFTTADEGSSVPSCFVDSRNNASRLYNFDRRECYIKKIVFSTLPGHEDFVAIALYGAGMLASLRGKDTVWCDVNKHMNKKVVDIVYRNKSFWAITPRAEVIAIELSTWKYREGKIPYEPIYNAPKFIAFDSDGNLYLILRNGDFQMRTDGKKKFHTRDLTVMKLNPHYYKGMTHNLWVRVEDLNGHSLYVGNNNGFFSRDMRSNCVYFTSILSKDEIFDMGVYDMEKKSFETIYPSDMELNSSQPPPIWFKPRLIF